MRKHNDFIFSLDRTVKRIILEIVFRRLVYVGNLTVVPNASDVEYPAHMIFR
jgi:hypothetical protein